MKKQMNNKTILILLLFISQQIMGQDYKIYGHRGCRGLLPENTIPAFQKAIDLGVDGIEWDVVVNKDNELIISHEPYMDASYCLDTTGNEISKSKEENFNIREMSTEEVQQFDCGSKVHDKFKDQKKIKSIKPTVQDTYKSIDFKNTEILFEIKSEKKDYGTFQPFPKEYAKIILQETQDFKYKDQIIFMCFDAELLNELHRLLPNAKFIYLTYLPFKSIDNFLNDIDFKPFALGMYHKTIKKKDVKKAYLHEVNIYAWTVNKLDDFEKMKRYGVTGIITDYPNLIKKD